MFATTRNGIANLMVSFGLEDEIINEIIIDRFFSPFSFAFL